MPGNLTYTISTSVEELNSSFIFGPDCLIEKALPEATKQLLMEVAYRSSRVTAVDGIHVGDSGELKEALLRAVTQHTTEEFYNHGGSSSPAATTTATAATKHALVAGLTPITVTFERTDGQSDVIAIENSVTCNGAISKVVKPNPESVKEMMEDITPNVDTEPPSASAVLDAELRSSLRRSMNGLAVPPQLLSASPKMSLAQPTMRKKEDAADAASRANQAGQASCELQPAVPVQMGTSPQLTPSALASPTDNSDLERSIAASEASSSDFNTVRICQLSSNGGSGEGFTTTVPAEHESPTPGLLEFEKMKLSIRADDARAAFSACGSGGAQGGSGDIGEMTVKSRLRRALDKVQCGQCVICVTQDVNPVAEIELLALAAKRRVVAFDLGVKLRLRPKPDVLVAQFAEAMRIGAWFVLINAHKSINTCLLFADLLKDTQEHHYEGVDPNARIIIALEPHPHFPKSLIQNAVVIKLVSTFYNSSILSDSLAASTSRARLVTADALTQSQIVVPSSRVNAGGLKNPASTAAAPTAVVQRPPKKQVRISAAVDIVDIAPREVVKAPRRDCPIDVSGSVALCKTFSGVDNDKFLCVRCAGEPGRFAVGSSCGNVYFLDSHGNSLLQAHAHNASIWDVSFCDKFNFATGCEDGTSASWRLGTPSAEEDSEDAVLVPTSATSLGSDVYCVSYVPCMNPSPLLIGGLHSSLVIREAESDSVHLVPISSNAQVVDCLPSSATVLVGGGDGSVCVVDVAMAKSLGVICEHTRKVPALTVRDDHQFFTGSFDSSILSWDLRVPGGVTAAVQAGGGLLPGGGVGDVTTELSAHTMHTLKLKNYVTGLDVDEIHLAASVGENLYLWDVRKLNTVLGGYPQGWKGLSRGIKVQSTEHLVVTASPDGFVRFWNYV